MRPWNVIVTVRPDHQRVAPLLGELRRLGDFHGTAFRDVLAGQVPDAKGFLDALVDAREAKVAWMEDVVRAIPVECVFAFTPDDLVEQWSARLPGFLERMQRGTCYVRLERRGLVGQVHSVAVERAVADRLFELADARGLRLAVSFSDPDYILLGETLGNECGLAFITREVRQRYPFVQAR